MMKSDRRARLAVAGFTLIEMLIATALMGLVLAALATVTAQWLPNWNRGFARVQRSELVSIALDRLVADLGSAEFITPSRDIKRPLFDGTELSVTLVRSAFGPNTRPGLEVVRIAETADQLGSVLLRSNVPFAPSSPNAAAPRNFANPVVLLRAPYRVSFAYAGHDDNWKNTWLGENELPAIVRVTVRDAASERTLAVSTAAMVHVDLPAECVRPRNKRECTMIAAADSPDTDQARPPNQR